MRSVVEAAASGAEVHFHLPANGKSTVEQEKTDGDGSMLQSPLEQLFARLGGGKGRIQAFRVNAETAEESYCGQMPIDEGLVDNFEERFATRFGGGKFAVRFFTKPEGAKESCVGRTFFTVDESLFPLRKSNAEMKREGIDPNAPPAPPLDHLALLRAVDEMIARRIAQQPAAARSETEVLVSIMAKKADDDRALMLELIKTRSAPAAAPPATNAAQEISTWVDVIDKLRGDKGSDAGDSPATKPGTSMVLAALDRGLGKLADRAGDKLGDTLAGMFAKEAAPGAAAAPTALAAGPSAQAQAAPRVTVPRGAIPIANEEELQKLRAQAQRGVAPAASEVVEPKK